MGLFCLMVAFLIRPHHWLRPEPIVEVAALLLRHFGFRPVRGHGSVLFDGCLPHPVRPLSSSLLARSRRTVASIIAVIWARATRIESSLIPIYSPSVGLVQILFIAELCLY